MNMAKMMLKIIVNKVIIKVHKYNSNDGIEYESEDDDISVIVNIICISVIVRLVSITPCHVKLD